MILRQKFLDGIASERITLAFRRWRRPTVRAGGTLLTTVGQLEIASVTPVGIDDITDAHARRAGYATRKELLAELERTPDGRLYRIQFGALRPDPRVALRSQALTSDDAEAIEAKLARLDARAAKPWTRRTLELIAAHSGTRAGTLADRMGQERDDFKVNVRKLKALGLTESLEVGYRLSPRGRSLLGRRSRP
jgi:hypothetical protein